MAGVGAAMGSRASRLAGRTLSPDTLPPPFHLPIFPFLFLSLSLPFLSPSRLFSPPLLRASNAIISRSWILSRPHVHRRGTANGARRRGRGQRSIEDDGQRSTGQERVEDLTAGVRRRPASPGLGGLQLGPVLDSFPASLDALGLTSLLRSHPHAASVGSWQQCCYRGEQIKL